MTEKTAEFAIVVRTPGGPENLEWAETPTTAPGANVASGMLRIRMPTPSIYASGKFTPPMPVATSCR